VSKVLDLLKEKAIGTGDPGPGDPEARAKWVEGRKAYVGASEVAAVMGLSPWDGPVGVWMKKTGRKDGHIEGLRLRKGTHMESFILEEAAEALAVTVESHPMVLQHPEVPALCCNLDGFAFTPEGTAVVEAKCTNSRNRKALKEWAAGGRPAPGTSMMCWWVQVQTQLEVSNLDLGYLAVECDGDLFVIEIPRDRMMGATIADVVGSFWGNVQEDQMPAPSGADSGALGELYHQPRPEIESISFDDMGDALSEYREVAAKLKELGLKKKELENTLKGAMAWADTAKMGDDIVCTWRSSERNTVDTARLKAERPEVYAEFVKTSTSRLFKVR